MGNTLVQDGELSGLELEDGAAPEDIQSTPPIDGVNDPNPEEEEEEEEAMDMGGSRQ